MLARLSLSGFQKRVSEKKKQNKTKHDFCSTYGPFYCFSKRKGLPCITGRDQWPGPLFPISHFPRDSQKECVLLRRAGEEKNKKEKQKELRAAGLSAAAATSAGGLLNIFLEGRSREERRIMIDEMFAWPTRPTRSLQTMPCSRSSFCGVIGVKADQIVRVVVSFASSLDRSPLSGGAV